MEGLVSILRRSLLLGVGLFVLLFAADRLFPGLFTTRVEWWLLPILVAVHAIPRLIYFAIGAARRAAAGRRKP
jgi:hypothetical protein